MADISTKTTQQAILDTAKTIGEENAIYLFKSALPQLEARLTMMQSATNVEDAMLAAKQSISPVKVYGSGNLEKLLGNLLNQHYSSEQLPDVISAVCIELKASVEEMRGWLQSSQVN